MSGAGAGGPGGQGALSRRADSPRRCYRISLANLAPRVAPGSSTDLSTSPLSSSRPHPQTSPGLGTSALSFLAPHHVPVFRRAPGPSQSGPRADSWFQAGR